MKTREGIYFGNREIVERYVGDKLIWEKWKEILVIEGKATLNTKDDKNMRISIRYRSGQLQMRGNISPFLFYGHYGNDDAIIKNSYLLLGNKKYKHVTIFFLKSASYGIYSDMTMNIKFSSQTEYDEILKQFDEVNRFQANVIVVDKQ